MVEAVRSRWISVLSGQGASLACRARRSMATALSAGIAPRVHDHVSPKIEELAMSLIDRLGSDLSRGDVTLELDEIQATVLRYRPEPYYGTHILLHVDDARAGREFLRRLAPHVDS